MKLKEVIGQIEVWQDWVNAYKKYVPKFIEEAISKEKWQDWDNEVFKEFFEKSNDQCVSSLRQGYFTNIEKEKIKEHWEELAPLFKQIAASQTIPQYDLYAKVEGFIRRFTTQHRRASTYRLIAGLQSELLCTIVNKDNLKDLFVALKKNVDEPIDKYTGNWYKDSFNVAQYYKKQLTHIETMDLITYPWQTMVHFTKGKIIKSNEMSEGISVEAVLKVTTNPLNQILYGPPGTGKTYNTVIKAISVINPSFDLTQERKVVKAEYDRLIKDSQIVFTTFHQSMSYEDFIEGIKPKTIDNQVIYEVEDGIFKKLCQKASVKNGNFDEVIEKFKHDISELDGKKVLTIQYGSNNSFDVIYRGTSVFYVQPKNSTKKNPWYPVNINNMRIAFDTNDYSRLYNPTYIREILNYLIKDYGLIKGKEDSNKNYVLIIDEINRGNVSQIFGELITLIEEDKRLGNAEALEVTLPYSNDKFGVPYNLYIIGTMNTADRSVEALDTALRRRFCFEEIASNPELIKTEGKAKENQGIVGDINLPKVLEVINNRIEILSSRDYKIGHAYFMKTETLEDLKETFKKNIIPLLQEYFYNDYEKIGWVVGEGFFIQQKIDKKSIFTKFFKEPKPEFKVAYHLADIDTIDIKKAMQQLLGDFKEEPQIQNIEN